MSQHNFSWLVAQLPFSGRAQCVHKWDVPSGRLPWHNNLVMFGGFPVWSHPFIHNAEISAAGIITDNRKRPAVTKGNLKKKLKESNIYPRIMLQKYHPSSLFLQAEQFYNACTETAILQFLCLGTVLLHNSWILSIFFALHFSRAPLPSIKPLCATMQRLITLPINTSLPAPGSRGSGRNSRCLLLLLTSASTAVNLDHYDASLRRCSHPGEEPGNVRRREWEGENDERVCEDSGKREETERNPCLPVIVCGSERGDDETADFASVPRWQEPTLAQKHMGRNLSPDTFLLSRYYTKAVRNHGGFSALPLLSIGNSRVHAWWHQTVSLLEQIKCSFHICPGDCQPIGSTWQNASHKIRFLLPC